MRIYGNAYERKSRAEFHPRRDEMRAGTVLFLIFALCASTPAAAGTVQPAGHRQDAFPVPVSQTAADVQLLWSRLKRSLSPELYSNFDLFIYVNKAGQGSWAQHLYAFAKPSTANPDAGMILMLDAAVSTGREKMERAKDGEQVSTGTPAGFYELDPQRFETGHRSRQWQEDMPNAMFFDWSSNGVRTGLAIHGVTDPQAIAALGHRASAGCIQLSLEESRTLMDLVRDGFEGQVPRFAFDKKTQTTSNSGEVERDDDGKPVMVDGYRALVIIEDLERDPLTSQLVTTSAPQRG
jgi:hypothetical protein